MVYEKKIGEIEADLEALSKSSRAQALKRGKDSGPLTKVPVVAVNLFSSSVKVAASNTCDSKSFAKYILFHGDSMGFDVSLQVLVLRCDRHCQRARRMPRRSLPRFWGPSACTHTQPN